MEDRIGLEGKRQGQSARALIPFPKKKKIGRVSLSLCVCVCVQAERAMPGTLLLLIAMEMLIRSFSLLSSLVSVLRLAPCGLRLCFLQGARLTYRSRPTRVYGFLASTFPASRTEVTNSSSEPSSHRSSFPQPSRSSTSSRLP
jgi:hypothetical protein